MNLNSILIGSDDMQRLVDYYTRLFGKPEWNEEGYVGWRVGSGGFTVSAHDQVKGKNPNPGRIIWNIETPDVKSEFDRLAEAGAIVIREPYDVGDGENQATVCTLADPDDNYFQLVSPME